MGEIHPALGLDYGAARIGVAATDVCGILAHPVGTIHVEREDVLARLAEIIAQRKIVNLVLGLPLRMDGSEGTAVKKVRAFGKQLREKFPHLPLFFVDESFTTMSAAAKLHEAGRKAKQQKQVIDQAAAVEILQIWMQEKEGESGEFSPCD